MTTLTPPFPINPDEAMLNVTYDGNNGEYPSAVPLSADNASIFAWATEAVQSGSIAGIPQRQNVNFAGFVIDRFPPTDARPWNLFMIRSKTEFGF